MPFHAAIFVRRGTPALFFYAEARRPRYDDIVRKIIRYRHRRLRAAFNGLLATIFIWFRESFSHTSIINPDGKAKPVEFYLFFR